MPTPGDAEHLFGAYFYEDWDQHEYASWEDAVDDFARRSPNRLAGAASDLSALLLQVRDTDELGERLRALGCAYLPEQGDQLWLTEVIDRLDSWRDRIRTPAP